MVHQHIAWIKFFIKVVMIFTIGYLWISDSFAGAENAEPGEHASMPADASDYYWVGGSGNWSDLAHWATTSGGSTKQTLLPGEESNVHFDQNSFSSSDQSVVVDVENANFKSMDWTGVQFNPTLSGDTTTMMRCFGSFTLAANMIYNYQGQSIEFLSTNTGQTIDLAGQELLCDIHFYGKQGEWILTSDFKNKGFLWLHEGVFDTNGSQLITEQLHSSVTPTEKEGHSTLKLRDSKVIITGDETGYAHASFNILTEPGTSTVIMPGGGAMNTRGNLYDVVFLKEGNDKEYSRFLISDEEIAKNFHNITFNGRAYLYMVANQPPAEMTFNKVTFLDNGDIHGTPFNLDTLIFSAGKTYNITKISERYEHLLGINKHFDIRGVECQPITIKSYFDDYIANIVVPSGTVTGSHLRLQGINVSGGATFYAGENSEDLGDNNGWIFENAPTENGFLGEDKMLTAGIPLTLDATHYGQGITYLWNSGQTTPTIKAASCGEYFVEVSFEQECVVYDTINITSTRTVTDDLIDSIINASCMEQGKVGLNQEIVSNALSTYTIQLINQNSEEIHVLPSNEHVFENLEFGTYSLKVEDQEGCVSMLSKEIVIDRDNSLLPSGFLVRTIDSNCMHLGQVEIDLSVISNLPDPFNITLIHSTTNEQYVLASNTSIFSDLAVGSYELELEDGVGCLSLYPDPIQIEAVSSELSLDFLVNTIDANCEEKGGIEVDRSLLFDVPQPYSVVLTDVASDNEYVLQDEKSIFSNLGHGVYKLRTEDAEGCLRQFPDEIRINRFDSNLSSSFLVGATDATCGQKGEIEIDRSLLSNASDPQVVYLIDLNTSEEYILAEGVSKFTNLSEGTYSLWVVDSNGCKYVHSGDIIINLNESGCRTSVFTPASGETLTIPFQGLVNIYDRNGRLIRRFNAPGEWDGRDQNGQALPIGNYVLIADENRKNIIEVTIIR